MLPTIKGYLGHFLSLFLVLIAYFKAINLSFQALKTELK